MKPTIYVAAPYEMREEAIFVMHKLEEQGYEVTSSWLREVHQNDDEHARIDLADVTRANEFLLLNPEEYRRAGTGGRHVELGYALGQGKYIVLLGVRTNIFHHLSEVHVIERLEDLWES